MPAHKKPGLKSCLMITPAGIALSHIPTAVGTVNTNRNPVLLNSSRREHPTRKGTCLKAYVSKKILKWHSLSLSLSADLCIHCLLPEPTEESKSKKNDSKFSPTTKTVHNIFRYSILKPYNIVFLYKVESDFKHF